jgi:hypothetical protein
MGCSLWVLSLLPTGQSMHFSHERRASLPYGEGANRVPPFSLGGGRTKRLFSAYSVGSSYQLVVLTRFDSAVQTKE